jgi:hypothetical protein
MRRLGRKPTPRLARSWDLRYGSAVRAVILSLLLAGCAASVPPMSHAIATETKADSTMAKLVFLWPPDNCEAGGYYVIATRDGRFIGTLGRRTRLETSLAPGSYAFMTWNAELERLGGAPSIGNTSVLRADLREGRTYFARLAFGEWNVRGPAESWSHGRGTGSPTPRCVGSGPAIVALAPRSKHWRFLDDWLRDLTPIAPETESGERWLAAQPSLVSIHRDLVDARELQLSAEARSLASIEPTDGVADQD